jgi:hypothetical protein
MSLFFCYHDPVMAVVASDDRSCVEQNGKVIVMPERVPKFFVLTGGDRRPMILSGLGRGDLVNHVQTAVAEIVREQKFIFTDIARMMPSFLQKVFANRRPAPGLPNDNLLLTLIGFNSTENCMWVIAWWSGYNFAPMPLPPFFAFGVIDASDNDSLQELQDSIIEKRPNHDATWIASEFQKKMLLLSQKHRERIGAPSYFAAIDLHGIVELPKEFPLPVLTEISHDEEDDFAPGRSAISTIRLNKFEPPQDSGPITSHVLSAAYPTNIGIGGAPSSARLRANGIDVINPDGQIDISTNAILPKGSIAGVATQPFSYTATTTSVTLTWTGMTISRLDGTTTAIPDGNQTITGLTAGQTYDFYPYWDEVGSTLKFVQSSDVTLPNLTGVSLNGTTGQITTTNTAPDLSGTSATWEMWLWPASGGSYQGVMEIANSKTGTPTNASLTLENSGTYLRVWVGGTLEITASKAMTPNAWNHVMLTWSHVPGSGTLTLYLNGVNVGALSSITTMPSITGYYRIGFESPPTWSTYFFDGYLSHVSVYPSALTSTQVQNHYSTMTQEGVGTYESLVATDGATSLWKLTETSGTTAADSIGTNTGTYTGGYTLDASAGIGQAQGSPSIAWQSAPYAVTQFQYLQTHAPISAGPFPVSTPSSGTGGGLNGGFQTPNLPYGLAFY